MSDLAIAVLLIVGTLANILQVVFQFYTMREVGDLDKDKKDWWEHKSKRKSKKRR